MTEHTANSPQASLTDPSWLATSLGQYIINNEFDYFDQLVANIFGYNAIQLGLPHYDFLRANRMPLRFSAGYEAMVALRARVDHLPISSESIDLVIMPHVLEFNTNPHQILHSVFGSLVRYELFRCLSLRYSHLLLNTESKKRRVVAYSTFILSTNSAKC